MFISSLKYGFSFGCKINHYNFCFVSNLRLKSMFYDDLKTFQRAKLEKTVLLVTMDLLDLVVMLAKKGLKVQLVLLDLLEPQEIVGHLDLQGPVVSKVFLVLQEILVLLERMVKLVSKVHVGSLEQLE